MSIILAIRHWQLNRTPELPILIGLVVWPVFLIFLIWNIVWLGVYAPLCRINNWGQCLYWRFDLLITPLIQAVLSLIFQIFLLTKKQVWIWPNFLLTVLGFGALSMSVFNPHFLFAGSSMYNYTTLLSYFLIFTGIVDILCGFYYYTRRIDIKN